MIYRIDVRPLGADGHGAGIRRQITELGYAVGPMASARVFLLDTDATEAQVNRIAGELLADTIVESFEVVQSAPNDAGRSRIEIHLKPGVMDPVASSTEMAIRDMGLTVRQVRTGRAYLIDGLVKRTDLQAIASRVLANGVIESVHFDAFLPKQFEAGHESGFKLTNIDLRHLNDDQLKKLSREGHLFLSLTEMKAVQSYFLQQNREPTDIELETIAQTWSEHCVHKTLKSAVEVMDESGKTLRSYGNLIKDTIFASTMKLMEGSRFRVQGSGNANDLAKAGAPSPSSLNPEPSSPNPFCLSVFKDNAGVIVFDDVDAVCFKVETHNHPSAIEPYGGSATGAGGCIRDVMGTGLSAKPIANTDIFCVAYPEQGSELRVQKGSGFGVQGSGNKDEKAASSSSTEPRTLKPEPSPNLLPKGIIHPKRILQQVVAGVRDYGNRMGIPTINGAVYFDDRYLGNPLVFCGCVGLIPRNKIDKQARPGDRIVVMGGRTGRDGIHGATFSSAELTDTHADEFSHAVQIGNAISQKKTADVILQARDLNLFTAITDCGAGGLSSAVGEMGEKTGAVVELDAVPLKYAGLRYDEIWISEAQERMVLSVPAENVAAILKLSEDEDVESTVIGTFGTEDRQLILNYRGTRVGQMSMQFLHDGIPMPTRKARVAQPSGQQKSVMERPSPLLSVSEQSGPVASSLLKLLAHPNIVSKHWIIRQYDHEVQGGSVVKPLTGPMQTGPSDASVFRPKLSSYKGVALGCGMVPAVIDPYEMAIASIDEAVRNVVAVGADPSRVAILDNFCWPSVDDEKTMGTLVRACEACHDAALAYGIPFISGKDSLHNQFTNQETGEVLRIPNTLLISAIAVIEDVRKCITMDLKQAGNTLLRLKPRQQTLTDQMAVHRALSKAIADGLIRSCHDISEGGALVAAAEMCIASGLGLDLPDLAPENLFAELNAGYLIEVDAGHVAGTIKHFRNSGVTIEPFGQVDASPELQVGSTVLPIAQLHQVWRGTLDW